MEAEAARDHRNTRVPHIPEELAALADQPRVLVRRAGPPRKRARSVVYWMQRAVRIVDNPALDVAIEAANLLGLPVVVYFGVIPNYPNANLRHYHFLQQGLRDVAGRRGRARHRLRRPPRARYARSLSRRGAGCAADRRRESLPRAGALAAGAGPASQESLTGPSMPTSWFLRASSTAALRCCTTSGRISRPSCRSFSSRRERSSRFTHGSRAKASRASSFAGHHRRIQRSSTAPSSPSTALPAERTPRSSGLASLSATIWPPTTRTRNHPEIAGTSRLSPYLHFGNIGPLTIALAVKKAANPAKISLRNQAKDFWSS